MSRCAGARSHNFCDSEGSHLMQLKLPPASVLISAQEDLRAASKQVADFTSKLEAAEKQLKAAEGKLSAAEKDSAETRTNLEQVRSLISPQSLTSCCCCLLETSLTVYFEKF